MLFQKGRGFMRLSVSRMLYLFCLLTTAFLLVMLFAAYTVFAMNSRNSAREYILMNFEGVSSRVERKIHDIKEDILNITESDEVITFFQDSHAVRFTKVDGIRKTLALVTKFRSEALELFLLRADGSLMRSGATNEMAMFMVCQQIVSDNHLQTPFRNVMVMHDYMELNRADCVFSIAAPIYANYRARTTGGFLGAVVVVCSIRDMFTDESISGMPLWVTADDDVLMTSDARFSDAWRESPDSPVSVDGRPYHVISSDVSGTPWKLVGAYSDAELFSGVESVGRIGLIIVGGIVFSMLLLMMTILRSIVGPIINIAQQTENIATLSGQVHNPSEGRNELMRLTQGINSMMARLEQMNREVAESQRVAYSANLSRLQEYIMRLQTQINPHFLYNSLESIRGMAAEGRADAVREMCSLVASVYRYCVRGEHTVTLAEEIESARRYFGIVVLRYGEKYTLSVDADADALACTMPRMILQPLVENAVLHGFTRAGRQNGKVWLSGEKRGRMLQIAVEDDGDGISDEEMRVMNESLARLAAGEVGMNEAKIGVWNIACRTVLISGGENRVIFQAREGGGVRIALQILQTGLRPQGASFTAVLREKER